MSPASAGIADHVIDHMVSHRLLPAGGPVKISALSGGVSNDVLAVTGSGVDVVVKHALAQLRVEEEWYADPQRIRTEGRALQVADELLPGTVPRVLDNSDGFLVIDRAPNTWTVWKQPLLHGQIDPIMARRIGEWLGAWQAATAQLPALQVEFANLAVFTDLRIDPFHRTVAARHPDLAASVGETVEAMDADRRCVVHGDFSPKNILVAPERRFWIIDWEVVHTGDPTFDPAWVVGHLILKSIRRPDLASNYQAAADEFLAGRDMHAAQAVPLDRKQLARQVGCLILARVDGKSPVDYLDASGRDLARIIGRQLLLDPSEPMTAVWRQK